MAAAKAYLVRRGDDEAGFLGEGRGPFITASHAATDHPRLRHARFTSLHFPLEIEVAEILDKTDSFAAVVRLLNEAGFTLEPLEYNAVFQPPGDEPPTSRVSADDYPDPLDEF